MKITFIGGGNMAFALIGGLLARGFTREQIMVVEPLAENRQRLNTAHGISCYEQINELCLDCAVIMLAVKPQQMQLALAPLVGKLEKQLILSIAAGVRLVDIASWLGGYSRLVRSMPNTPALIGAGLTGLYASKAVAAEERQQVEQIMAAAGQWLWVENEEMLDAITAISGSGPAYVFYFIEALQAAAQELGFSAEQAKLLSLQTFHGAVALALAENESIATLRQRVTSKGGTTEAALATLASEGVAAAISRAAHSAMQRSRELGEELGSTLRK